MPKNCINCGCPISGEGKNKVFCDACLRKISPFLKFISTSRVPAVKLYEANEEKLRSMGLSDMALAYVSKCCSAYDEKKAAAAAPIAPVAPTPAAYTDDDTPTDEPVVVPSENTDTADSSCIPSEADEYDDEYDMDDDSDTPAAIAGLSSAADQLDYSDSDIDEEKDSGKRLALIIVAAVLTLIIFLVLYIGKYIPGYSPDKPGKDSSDKDTVSDSINDESDSESESADVTDDDSSFIESTFDDSSADTSIDDTSSADDTSSDDTSSDDTSDSESTECIHEWVDATCSSPSTCLLCGATEGTAIGHDYKDATCTEPQKCSRCGETKGAALGHDANDATCTADSVCKRCGKTVKSALGHSYKDATCTEAQKCSRCGDTKGSALGHDYKDATCTEPQKCSRCGDKKGSALGHTSGGAKCLRCDKYFVSLTAIGNSVTNSDGLIITVTSINKVASADGFDYTIKYTVQNNNEDSCNIGDFKLFYVDSNGKYNGVMFGNYDSINPKATENYSITLKVPSGMTPIVLEYCNEVYKLEEASAPHTDGSNGVFFWKVS